MVDFEDAKDKVLMGSERRSMLISDKEKETTAYHEAGHALVAMLLNSDQVDPVHKVTIIPRGRALGLTQQLPSEDRLSMTREFALNRIAIMMGGRVAEEIIFNQVTTGAGNDIEQATDLARRMVSEWGMSDAIGPLNYSGGAHEVFLGREMTQGGDSYSEATAQKIDGEIARIVTSEYKRATELLEKHRSELEMVAKALLEHETLSGDDIKTLFDGGTLESRTDVAVDEESSEPEVKEKKRPSLFPPIRPVGKKDPDPEPA